MGCFGLIKKQKEAQEQRNSTLGLLPQEFTQAAEARSSFSLNPLTRLAVGFGLESALPQRLQNKRERIHPMKPSFLSAVSIGSPASRFGNSAFGLEYQVVDMNHTPVAAQSKIRNRTLFLIFLLFWRVETDSYGTGIDYRYKNCAIRRFSSFSRKSKKYRDSCRITENGIIFSLPNIS